MFNKYYLDELSYLREMGKEFASKYPSMAPFLAGKGNDPDIERLLEGFAFLTAQIRQKLDDELPELTHSLINFLFPHYLRPIPSMAILQFEPNFQRIRDKQLIKAGIEVESNPVDDLRCKFQTCYDTFVYPIDIRAARFDNIQAPALRISCDTINDIPLNKIDISGLRFYLHGEPQWELYLYLFNYLKKIRVQTTGSAVNLAVNQIKPVGFLDEESSLKNYPANSFSGYRLMQEYFAFPEKFLFFELSGLEALKKLGDSESFEIVFEFERELSYKDKISKDNILLNCVPITNLFSHPADPISLDQNKTEYRVCPSGEDHNHYEIYSIDKVIGYVQGSSETKIYNPFNFFANDNISETEKCFYYNLRLKPSLTSWGVNHFLSFVTLGTDYLPEPETISMELTCTNRNLPKDIRTNEIVNATSSSPEFARFKNITKPTNPLSPPVFDSTNLFFKLISHLSLNYQTVAQTDNLRQILRVYNFHAITDKQEARAHELRLNGIIDVRSYPATRFFKGTPVHGVETAIRMKEGNFSSEGEMYLFASLLNEFLAEYVTLNSFSQLSVTGEEHREVYKWFPKTGQQILI